MKLQQELTKLIKKTFNNIDAVELEYPSNKEFGELSTNVALKNFSKLDQEYKDKNSLKNLMDYASFITKELQQKIASHTNLSQKIKKIEVVKPGFINFYFTDDFLISSLSSILNNSNFGKTKLLASKTWELEHTSPNPNKAMHLGHLRNNVTGMAIAHLWEAVGAKVICDAVNNNRGIAIARLMWGFLKFARKDEDTPIDIKYWHEHPEQWQTPQDVNLSPDKFVDQLYAQASADFEENQTAEKTVRQMVVDWENKDKLTWELWKLVLDYSLQGQAQTLKRLGNRWDKVWHEHEHYQMGKELVEKGLKKEIFKKLDDGAILTDLEKYNLPDTILQKKDGTSLYITQDIALTKLKVKTFKANKLHWLVGPEQSLALKQLFAVCDQLGIANYDDLTHIDFGYMTIKGQGKMSSRKGNVIYVDDVIDDVKLKVSDLMQQQANNIKDQKDIAEKIAVGAVKYSILKVARRTDMAFNVESALKIDGNSGPYLQYAYARASSVIEKANFFPKKSNLNIKDINEEEKDLIRHLIKLPEIVNEAATTYEPSLIATYTYQACQLFNSFYNKHQILKESKEIKNFRLSLTFAFKQVLDLCLEILGIEPLQQM